MLSNKKSPATIRIKHNIPEAIKLSIEITHDGWFLVRSPELPGLITQARDAKELLEMVNDAILTYFDVPEKEADKIFDQILIEGEGTILQRKQREKVLAFG